jgi:hypothetical protein
MGDRAPPYRADEAYAPMPYPGRPMTQDELNDAYARIDQAYAEHDDWLRNAWKGANR